MQNRIYPVILAGGTGTRLWPKSREKHPKQFIQLLENKSLFQETCLRFSDQKLFGPLTVITHEEYKFLVRDQLQEINILNATIITEPVAKNTLAACLSGAHFLKNTIGNIPVLFTPADHIIKNEKDFLNTLNKSLSFILDGYVCAFGITPTHPHTGYGYITTGKKLKDNIFISETFIEKPAKEEAEKIIKNGGVWNSGIYFCTTKTLEDEARLYTESIQEILQDFFNNQKNNSKGFFNINKEIYEKISPTSIDKGIMEKTKKMLVAPISIIWSDLGSWDSLYQYFEKNEDGNVVHGQNTLLIDTKNSYIDSEKRLVTTLGLKDVGIIETQDAILVFSLSESERVKNLVQNLVSLHREEVISHTKVHRPWGKYEILGDDVNFKSKKITVLPGAELSLQRHKHRAEHWIVVSGTATVTRNNEIFELRENESTFLPMGSIHRLQNKHEKVLVLIEIQTGTYFGEDDIERFEDVYGRL